MKLSSLLGELGAAPAENDAEITLVTDDPARACPGALLAVTGRADAQTRQAAARALSLGAAVVASDDADIPGAVRTPNPRLAYGVLCAAFFGHPDRKMKLIGITGTNGKTTTAWYIRHLLESAGAKCAVIGTLGADTGEGNEPTGYTTPPPDVFCAALAKAAAAGSGYCVCEVSSQALAQYRAHGVRFRVGAMTNIGSDHLDYHKTVARLVEAKTRLCALSDAMLVNADDAYADAFLTSAGGEAKLYSCRNVLSDYAAKNIRLTADGADYILFDGNVPVKTHIPAPGMFSVYNSLCAAGACMMLGLSPETLGKAMGSLPAVPGRMQTIQKNGVRFCVDFAHTPQALQQALTALRQGTGGKLIAVFGCGGDRDRTKRPVMGRIAERGADCVILTSDNPRSEDPARILEDIRAGIKNKRNVFTEPDRKKAIRLAYEKAAPGDTVLVAGKGHETYQIVGERTLPFSDTEVICGL